MKYPGSAYWRGLNYPKAAVKLSVPAFFIAGYAFTAEKFTEHTFSYLALNFLACLSASVAAVMLLRRGRLPAAWLVFLIMLVFGYAKFYGITLFPDLPCPFFPSRAAPFFESADILFRAFIIQTVSFAALCATITAFVLADTGRGSAGPSREKGPGAGQASGERLLSWSAVFLFPVLAYLVHTYKIGILGRPSDPLPLHLSGLIFYSQIIILPGLILSQVHFASKAGDRKMAFFGGALLFLWSAGDALLRGSKGSLLLAPLLIVFLWLSGGIKFRKGETFSILAAGSLALLSTPFMAAYRICRLSGATLPAAIASSMRSYSSLPVSLLESVVFIFFRIPGIETAVVVLGLGGVPLGFSSLALLFSGGGISGYITQTLFSWPSKYPNSFASSFLAGAYLAGGYAGVVAFAILAGAASTFLWEKLSSLDMEVAPVALSFFLLVLFYGMTEGVSPVLFKQAAASIVLVLICEAAARLHRFRFLHGRGPG